MERRTTVPARRRAGRVATALLGVLAVAASLLQPIGAPQADAAIGSEFRAGNIISDALFFDGDAMSEAAVQSFIDGVHGTCAPGYTCIDTYRQATPSMAADAYCGRLSGRANESVASILARVGAACDVSQRTLLVLLQKEQSLVTDTRPSTRQFERATGFACPDTAPCDASFGGFFYQVYYAARQFQRYAAHPTSYNHRAGQWNDVLYHPNRSCGSSRVFIENAATAALYNYTPYQPNAAALGNLYGTGNSCSAYGNRNFWRMWTDWFGTTAQAGPYLVHQEGYPYIYVVAAGVRYRVHSDDMLAQLAPLGEPRAVTASVLQSTTLSSIPMQRVVRNSAGNLWLLNNGGALRIANCSLAESYGQSCTNVPTLQRAQIERFADRGYLRHIAQLPDGTMWFMQSGTKRELLDSSILLPYGVPSVTAQVTDHAISFAPIGAPVVRAGAYRTSNGSYPRLAVDAGRYVLSASQSRLGFMSSAGVLTGDSLRQLPTSGTVPTRMRVGSQGYVLVDEGWLRVRAAEYGGTARFTEMPADSERALPIVTPATRQHFVREQGSAQVWLVSGGYRQPMTSAQQAWTSRTFGVSTRVWETASDGLQDLRLRPPSLSSNLVRADGASTVYLVNGPQLHPVPDAETQRLLAPLGSVEVLSREVFDSFEIAEQAVGRVVQDGGGTHWYLDAGARYRIGSCQSATVYGIACGDAATLTSKQLGAFTDRGVLRRIVRLPDGTLWFSQGGERRQLLDPRILAPWGVPSTTTTLSAGAIDQLPVGVPVVAAGAYRAPDGSSPRLAVSAGRYTLTAEQARLGFLSSAGVLTQASVQALPTSGPLPTRMLVGSQAYVLVDEGWLRVSASEYGGPGRFTTMPANSELALPVVAPATRQHFVREQGSQQVWLISGGSRQAMTAAQQSWTSRTYGVSTRVWQTAAGGLADVPVR